MKWKASRLIKEIIAFASTDVLAKAFPFILMPFLSYYLTPEDFALATNFMLISSLSNGFIGLSGYSFFATNFYREKIIPQLIVNVLAVNFIIYLLVNFLAIVFEDLIYSFFKLPLTWVILAILTGLCLQIIEMTVTSLRFRKQLKDYSKYQTANAVTSTLLTVVLVIILAWSWKGRVLSLIITPLIFAGIGMYLLKLKSSIKDNSPKIEGMLRVVQFGGPLLPHKLSGWISNGVQKILITRFVGLLDMGIFSFSQLIVSALSVISGSVFGALSPEFYSRLSKIDESNNYDEKKKLMLLQVKIFLTVVVGVSLIYPVLVFLIKTFISTDYSTSIKYIPFFLGSFIMGIFYNLISVYIFHSNRVKFFGALSLTVSLIGVIINVFLIKYFGAIGAAYSILIISLIKASATFYYSQKVYPMPWIKALKIK